MTAVSAVPARAPGVPLTKAARQARVTTLLGGRRVRSQPQLQALLAEEGITVNQATLSRDLEELGATKARVGDGSLAYVLPEEGMPVRRPGQEWRPDARLARLLEELLVAAEGNGGELCLVRTPPGGAQLLGSALDKAGLPEVIGTVAGDDTVLLVCRRTGEGVGDLLAARLLRLADGGV